MTARPCVLDSSLILSLIGAGGFSLLDGNARYDWRITAIVRGELTRKADREKIDAMIAGGALAVAEIDTANSAEVAEWGNWSAIVDPGEAEAITLAVARNWIVAIEDRQAQRAIDRRVGKGRWINCANVLLDAVTDGRCSLDDGDALFRALDCYSGYKKAGITSLSQL